jgi:hypothetical protein
VLELHSLNQVPSFFNLFENAEPGIARETYVQLLESFLGKNSPQSDFRAKSYARFKEDSPN